MRRLLWPAILAVFALALGVLLAPSGLGRVAPAGAQSGNAPPSIAADEVVVGGICPPGRGIAFLKDVRVSDDNFPGQPLLLSWEQVSGPSIVAFSSRSVANPFICFKRPGEYDFRLFADDGQFIASDDVRVSVAAVSP